MTRRAWLISGVAAALPLRGDTAREAWDTLASAVAALGLGNASSFLAAFDPAMPGFDALRTDIQALLSTWDAQSSIDLVESAGDEGLPVLELEWLLRLTLRNDAARSVRSRQTVKCRFERQGKRWRVAEFTPLGMFAPPRA